MLEPSPPAGLGETVTNTRLRTPVPLGLAGGLRRAERETIVNTPLPLQLCTAMFRHGFYRPYPGDYTGIRVYAL